MVTKPKRPAAADDNAATTNPTGDAAGPVQAAEGSATVETVEDRVRAFVGDAEKLRDAIERRIRDADTAERAAREAYDDAQEAELRGDLAESREALESIAPLRQRAKELRASLSDFGKALADLWAQEPELREAAAAELKAAEVALKTAEHSRAARARVLGNIGIGTATLGKIRDTLMSAGAIEEPAPPEPAPAPKDARAGLPRCPRCRRNKLVEPVGDGLFTCRAGYHGRGFQFRARRQMAGAVS